MCAYKQLCLSQLLALGSISFHEHNLMTPGLLFPLLNVEVMQERSPHGKVYDYIPGLYCHFLIYSLKTKNVFIRNTSDSEPEIFHLIASYFVSESIHFEREHIQRNL